MMEAQSWSLILAELHALYLIYQSVHWTAQGGDFYGDHLLFQRLYEDVRDEIDAVAERALGMTGRVDIVNPANILVGAQAFIAGKGPTWVPTSLLAIERTFLEHISIWLEEQQSAGVENMLQGIADKHEEHVYLLGRRATQGVVHEFVEEMTGLGEARKRKRKRKKKPAWYIGGPISTGPGNPGFGSSGGGGMGPC